MTDVLLIRTLQCLMLKQIVVAIEKFNYHQDTVTVSVFLIFLKAAPPNWSECLKLFLMLQRINEEHMGDCLGSISAE